MERSFKPSNANSDWNRMALMFHLKAYPQPHETFPAAVSAMRLQMLCPFKTQRSMPSLRSMFLNTSMTTKEHSRKYRGSYDRKVTRCCMCPSPISEEHLIGYGKSFGPSGGRVLWMPPDIFPRICAPRMNCSVAAKKQG